MIIHLKHPIGYLEAEDFDVHGNLANSFLKERLPVFVMIQASFCGHCQTAKAAFQQLADRGVVTCMTIHADADRPSVKALLLRMDKIHANLLGYPSYVLYTRDGRKLVYDGKRDFASMSAWLTNPS